jgi:hypothetical protein
MELFRPLNDPTYAAKKIAVTGASANVSFPSGPQGVLIIVDTAAYVRVSDENSAATAGDTFVPANTPMPFYAPQTNNKTWYVSALQVSAAGNLYAKPINIR